MGLQYAGPFGKELELVLVWKPMVARAWPNGPSR